MPDPRRDRPASFQRVEDLNRVVRSMKQVEWWLVQNLNQVSPNTNEHGAVPTVIEVTAVKDSYDVYPANFIYRSPQHLVEDDKWWDASTEEGNVAGQTESWEGKNCTAVALNEDDVLEVGKRYIGFVIGYWDVTGYAKNDFPIVLVICEEKVHVKITGYNSGTDLYSGTRVKANGTAFTPTTTYSASIQRFPSNTVTITGVTPIPPVIPNDQVVEIKTDPDRAGFFYIVGAAGGMFKKSIGPFTLCVGGVAIDYLQDIAARDLVGGAPYSVSPPPPPPVVSGKWYCVNGECVFIPKDLEPPQRPDGGPFDTQQACIDSPCP